MHAPRKNDLPRGDLEDAANYAIAQMAQKGVEAIAFFKFTCPHCGERVTFNEPNALYEEGECAKCGIISPVLFGGFDLHLITNPK